VPYAGGPHTERDVPANFAGKDPDKHGRIEGRLLSQFEALKVACYGRTRSLRYAANQQRDCDYKNPKDSQHGDVLHSVTKNHGCPLKHILKTSSAASITLLQRTERK
jgi:hypothetical protein